MKNRRLTLHALGTLCVALWLAAAGCGSSDESAGGGAAAGADAAGTPEDLASAPADTTGASRDAAQSDPGAATSPDTSGSGAADFGAPPPLPGAPKIAVDPTSHAFSFIRPLDRVLWKQVDILNAGDAPLVISDIAFDTAGSPDFSLIGRPPLPVTVAPGRSAFVRARFQDIAGGAGTLIIKSNDGTQPEVRVGFTSNLKGGPDARPEPCIRIDPPSLNFGTLARGQSASLSATVRNCSDSVPLNISRVSRSRFLFLVLSDEFQLTPEPRLPVALAPGDALPVTVTYTPRLAGLDTGAFIFHNDDPAQPEAQLNVNAVGEPPPPEEVGLTIRLRWDTDETDVDSHFIEPGGSLFDCQSDCFFGNPTPDWGTQGDWLDDPFLDTDDVDGHGPEHINISAPQPGTYRFVVHYWDDTFDGSFAQASNATVEILSYGQVVQTFGPQHLDGTGRTWEVFTVDWPGAAVTALGGLGQNASASACFGFHRP